ncbi:MAG TPA: RNA polymerase sigma factor [Symbiobacteriaceae bacterium]|jgi:RNA polymerase sigma-70 factor (ECF subfamily)
MNPALSPPLDDEAGLVATAKADPAAFGPLYEQHVQRIYQYIRYRTGSAAEAEELTAQTFARALEYLPRYKYSGAPFIIWLYRIATSIMVAEFRRRKPVPLSDSLPTQTDLSELETVELRDSLLRELYRLPEQQQQVLVLVLRFAQDLSYDEIAMVMGRSSGALRQLAYRALQSLRERMVRREA